MRADNSPTVADTPVAEAIEYAQVGPGISPIQWERAEQTYQDQDHTFTLTGLQPNAEYAYRFVTAADGTWANSTKGAFSWFTTKTAPSNVSFTNLTDGEGVTSLTDITVQAGDPIHRFSSYGITSVELYVDDVPVGSYDVTPGTDSVVYTFHAGTLTDGLHQLHAVAYDDFWQETDADIQVLVGSSGGGLQSASVSRNTPLVTLASQSRTGRDKFRRVAQNGPRIGELTYTGITRKSGMLDPHHHRMRGGGSVGPLTLTIHHGTTKYVPFKALATSGQNMRWSTSDKGTMPPGTWRVTDQNYRPCFGPWRYIVSPTGYLKTHFPSPARNPKLFRIHGSWGPTSIPAPPLHPCQQYRWSQGCILLYKDDVLRLQKAFSDNLPTPAGIKLEVSYK